jgi:hydrogenase maturation protein HypF
VEGGCPGGMADHRRHPGRVASRDAEASLVRDRRKITVQGVVQGVGFRPFVYGLAGRLGLCGGVWNDTTGVVIDVEGDPTRIENFLRALVAEAPALARIERVRAEKQPLRHYAAFAIEPSEARDDKDVFLAPDVATCLECLGEFNAAPDIPHAHNAVFVIFGGRSHPP